MEKLFKRDISSLEAIVEFSRSFITTNGVSASFLFPLTFILEEIFTNMVKYQPLGKEAVAIRLQRTKNEITISMTDYDVDPFDITSLPEVDVERPVEERSGGGLGIHLVKQLVDRIDYRYVNRESTITMIKKLED